MGVREARLDRSDFTAGMGRLGVAFRREITNELTSVYYTALMEMRDRVWYAVVDDAIRNLSRFPTVADLRKLAWQHRTVGRPAAVEALPWPAANSEHANTAFALIQEILRTRMPPEERLEQLRLMATRYPDVGWEDAVFETALLIEGKKK